MRTIRQENELMYVCQLTRKERMRHRVAVIALGAAVIAIGAAVIALGLGILTVLDATGMPLAIVGRSR